MGNLVDYASDELYRAGVTGPEGAYGGLISEAVLELVTVFEKQGHSSNSAAIVRRLFTMLADFKPIVPLTFEDDEWTETREGHYQNKRNSAVFKDGKDGRAYYLYAFIKKTQNGSCWSGCLQRQDGRFIGRCFIKDPKNMPTVTIEVIEKEVAPDDWETMIKDEAQLEELAKYYDFEFETR